MEPKLDIVMICMDERTRANGLMFSEPLNGDECALFIFNSPSKQSFWNKNVSFAIDLGFFDREGVLVETAYLEAEQEKSIRTKHDGVKYVLETRHGWFTENEVKPGTSLWNLVDLTIAIQEVRFDGKASS